MAINSFNARRDDAGGDGDAPSLADGLQCALGDPAIPDRDAEDRQAVVGFRESTEQEGAIRPAQWALARSQLELVSQRERIAKDRVRIEADRLRLAAILANSKRQRRRLARKIRRWRLARRQASERRESRRRRLDAEIARRRERLAAALATARGKTVQGREQRAELRSLLKQRGAELRRFRGRIEQLEAGMAERSAEIDRLTQARDELSGHLARQTATTDNDTRQQPEMRSDRAALEARLATAERELEERRAAQAAVEQKLADAQRRFELALEDLREYRRRAAAGALLAVRERASDERSGGEDAVRFDWETQKSRLLSAMRSESDGEAQGAQRSEERATIEGTIRITDELLAHKDQEIAELKQVLDHQSSNLGSLAVGASAIAEMFDGDELIGQEREKLRALQAEWREKLRVAEIEISMERASLARERAAFDELMANNPTPTAPTTADGDPAPAKPRGRWLMRLGLKEAPDDTPDN